MKKFLFLLSLVAVSLIITACNNAGASGITNDDVVSAFTDAGLEAEEPTEMTKDDYGMAPMKATEGTRFLIPSLGEDSGGRIFTYDNDSDLEQMKEYYDVLGEESAMFFSWTIKHKNVLVQINGELAEETFEEYIAALEEL